MDNELDDEFTEVTSQSWFSRIAGSIMGVGIGLILVLLGIALLFWNEGRAVTTAKGLAEGAQSVVAAQADAVNPANNNKLVHVTGQATTSEVVSDPFFGVASNALRLGRDVEMYQWHEVKSSETQKKLGGGSETVTTYKYEKKWADTRIDSTHFKQAADHVNTAQMLASKTRIAAKNVTLGAYRISENVMAKMQGDEPLPLTSDNLEKLSPTLKAKAQMGDAEFYFGKDPQTPEIGDQKVKFSVLKPGVFSVVARQNGNAFEPYSTHDGREIMLVESGDISADLMFNHAKSQNQLFTWVLRGFGAVLIFFGLSMIFAPLSVIADVIPLLGDILGMGTALAALLLTMAISLVTISIAWIAYRPLLGGSMLAAAIAWLVWSKHLGSKAKASAV
jgi:hypothetical protein